MADRKHNQIAQDYSDVVLRAVCNVSTWGWSLAINQTEKCSPGLDALGDDANQTTTWLN